MIKIKIDEILEQQGKTRYWLAKETKTSPNAILKLASGETTSISFEVLDKILDVLKVKLEDILEHIPNEK